MRRFIRKHASDIWDFICERWALLLLIVMILAVVIYGFIGAREAYRAQHDEQEQQASKTLVIRIG